MLQRSTTRDFCKDDDISTWDKVILDCGLFGTSTRTERETVDQL